MRSARPRVPAIVSRRPGSSVPSVGMTTMRTTTARSSTSVMPIITRPWRECSSPRSMSSRASTMVLATERTMPTMAPWSGGHRGHEDVGQVPEEDGFGGHAQVSHRRAVRPSLERRILQGGGDAMTERRRAPAPSAQAKIKQLEARLAQVEADLARVRGTAAQSGLTGVKLAGIEKAMARQGARAPAGLKDSVNRLSRRLLRAKSPREAAQHVAPAPAHLRESLDRLARTLGESQQKVSREVSLLTRGLKAGVKAGRAAYQGRRR